MPLSEAMDLIQKSLTCTKYNGGQHTHIKIKEPDANAKLKNATLEYNSGDWLSFDPDRGRCEKSRMSALLTADKHHNHHRACDCVALINDLGKLTVVYIDMKSEDATGFEHQFRSTRQFVRYLIGLTEEFHSKKFDIIKERYVVLWGGGRPINLAKRPTRSQKKQGEGTQPNLPYKHAIHEGGSVRLAQFLS